MVSRGILSRSALKFKQKRNFPTNEDISRRIRKKKINPYSFLGQDKGLATLDERLNTTEDEPRVRAIESLLNNIQEEEEKIEVQKTLLP